MQPAGLTLLFHGSLSAMIHSHISSAKTYEQFGPKNQRVGHLVFMLQGLFGAPETLQNSDLGSGVLFNLLSTESKKNNSQCLLNP